MADVSDAERAIQRLNSQAPTLTSLEGVARYPLQAAAVTAAQLIDRTDEAARIAVGRLVAAGILRPLRQTQRYRAFEAVGVLQLVSDFESVLVSPTGEMPEARHLDDLPEPLRTRRARALGSAGTTATGEP